MKQITLKRGATLQFDAAVANAGGPVDLSAWAINSQVRSLAGELVGDITVIKADQGAQPGQYRLRAQTASWPTGLLVWDIAYAYPDGAGGQTISYTETVRITLTASQTEAPVP